MVRIPNLNCTFSQVFIGWSAIARFIRFPVRNGILTAVRPQALPERGWTGFDWIRDTPFGSAVVPARFANYNRRMSEQQPTPEIFHWIEGSQWNPQDGRFFKTKSPLDDRTLGSVSLGSEAVIDRAVQAAHSAFDSFRCVAPTQREKWLLQAAELLETRRERLVRILIDEIGSPVSKAEKEVEVALGILRASAGAVRRVTGRTYPSDIGGRLSYSVRQPLGVVAGMTPFNVPLIKAFKQTAMPLATGNTVVLLPSEETPLLVHEVARIYQDAGLPAGVLNVVYGDGSEIGDTLTGHPLVKAVGFTGSYQVGRHVMELCGKLGKRVTLELGGKNPLVVLDDADLKKAIPGCVVGAFLFQGQICMSASRIFVEKGIAPEFRAALSQAVDRIQVGDLHDPGTLIGPIINRRQRDRIRRHLEDAIGKGAQVISGNQWQGNILKPTLLSRVDDSMLIHNEETFGPVTSIYEVESPEEALHMANQGGFGLSGAIYTNQLDRAMEFAESLNAGMVHVNGSTIQDEPHVPFGGVGKSGFGREGADVAIDELTEWKWVTLHT